MTSRIASNERIAAMFEKELARVDHAISRTQAQLDELAQEREAIIKAQHVYEQTVNGERPAATG